MTAVLNSSAMIDFIFIGKVLNYGLYYFQEFLTMWVLIIYRICIYSIVLVFIIHEA